jgi:hypothetical protein
MRVGRGLSDNSEARVGSYAEATACACLLGALTCASAQLDASLKRLKKVVPAWASTPRDATGSTI